MFDCCFVFFPSNGKSFNKRNICQSWASKVCLKWNHPETESRRFILPWAESPIEEYRYLKNLLGILTCKEPPKQGCSKRKMTQNLVGAYHMNIFIDNPQSCYIWAEQGWWQKQVYSSPVSIWCIQKRVRPDGNPASKQEMRVQVDHCFCAIDRGYVGPRWDCSGQLMSIPALSPGD